MTSPRSDIVWSIMLIVTITHVMLAMRIDHDGEGGLTALISLLRRVSTALMSAPT